MNKTRVILLLFTLFFLHINSKAQYIEIPLRVVSCDKCNGTGINPRKCPVCNGTGYDKIERGHVCMACAGGLPYECPFCKNGKRNIVEQCKEGIMIHLPLWHHLDIIEDIYFIGNAEINRTHAIQNNKIQWCEKGTIQNQNIKRTTVSYDFGVCTSTTSGMMGMYDFQEIYSVIGCLYPDSIHIIYIPEPQMQRFLNKEGYISQRTKDYKVKRQNDSIFQADCRYVITPNHIVYGHEEYFFENGILTMRIMHGMKYTYKYLKFDHHGNWILRDEYYNNKINRQKRKIKYL